MSAANATPASGAPGPVKADRRTKHVRSPLLELDPDLGRLLTAEALAAARRDVLVPVYQRPCGPWPFGALPSGTTTPLGLLILDGILTADVEIDTVVSSELLGPGDLMRPWPPPAREPLLAHENRWTVLTPCRLAVLDQRCAASLRRYPEIYAVLMERMDLRARRLATSQAIAELNGVDRRLLAMFWHLAELWGRVTRGGVMLPLALPHWLLAQLVGARRPTVSAGLAKLRRDGAIERRRDGTWLLLGRPPSGAAPPFEHQQPHRGIAGRGPRPSGGAM
jgi:DNA-binding transcriptional ArsR family regulator